MDVCGDEPVDLSSRSDVQTYLAAVWQRVLRVDQVGVHDNFFKLGGDSIVALEMFSMITALGTRVDVTTLYEHPTVAEFCDAVMAARSE
jgi:aryl carrier-like protein